MTIRCAGHFGEWVQGRLGPDGPVVLLTLPCPDLFAEAERLGDGPLSVAQTPEVLPPAHVRAALDRTGGRAGRYRLWTVMPPGGGAGASTAALIALVHASGGAVDDLASVCLAVEGASDPLMLPQPGRALWASREARLIETLPPLPRAEILGGFWGVPERTDPKDTRFPDVSDLAAQLRGPVSLATLAAVASASAERSTALRGRADDPTPDLARRLGALGHLRAHTGSARGLIFAPGGVPLGAEALLRDAGFQHILRFTTSGGCA